MPEETPSLKLNLVIPSAELCDRLRTAITIAASRDVAAMSALRLAVCEFTEVLKAEGTTPEAVLIALKTVVNNRALPIIGTDSSDWSGVLLREKMSTWCIEEYYREKSA